MFSDDANAEIKIVSDATVEILNIAIDSFVNDDAKRAAHVEPLEQVVDDLKEQLRARHIKRLQKGNCTIAVGFVWADLLNNFERVSDHCSNIAGCILEMSHDTMDMHQYLKAVKHDDPSFRSKYESFAEKYSLAKHQ